MFSKRSLHPVDINENNGMGEGSREKVRAETLEELNCSKFGTMQEQLLGRVPTYLITLQESLRQTRLLTFYIFEFT